MVTLFCAIVGTKGSILSVDIDANQSVGHLKKAIKAEKPNRLKYVDADELHLFPAKTKDSAWLSCSSEDGKKLREGEKTPLLEKLTSKALKLRGASAIAEFLANMEIPKAKQIHVLVVVPDQEQQLRAQNVHDSVRMYREASIRQSQIIMLLEQNLASLPHYTSKSYSSAVFGQSEIVRLKEGKQIIDFVPVENGEAFWSEETQIQANAITNKAVFDAFITPFFRQRTRELWFDLTPDGFATHRGMFRVKPEPNDHVQRSNGFRFGVALEELFDCLILFESKLSISEAAFGQVARYLQNLCPEASASAILFDRHSFWLIKSGKTVVYSVQKAKWITKGSKTLFQDFISDNTSPWVSILTNACISLGVNVVEGDAFLGRGAYGRVFKVTGEGGKVFALKIGRDALRLHVERQALMKAQHTGLTIRPVGELIETPKSAALLLYPVEVSLPRPTTREEVRTIFELLWQLHASGLVHGDPCVPNVILTEEKALWIDLAQLVDPSPILKQIDATILTQSILSVPFTDLLSPALKQSLNIYGQSYARKS